MSSHVIYALLMLAAGIGVPILAAMNARLGTALASPQIAVLILILVAGVTMALVTLLTGLPKTLKADVPVYVYGAGLLFHPSRGSHRSSASEMTNRSIERYATGCSWYAGSPKQTPRIRHQRRQPATPFSTPSHTPFWLERATAAGQCAELATPRFGPDC